jgi:N6-L-threonylcarbamoyladenine synthase
LKLPFPGGPNIQKAAESGNPTAYHFPRAGLDGSLDFSFSGLKTAVLRTLQKDPDAAVPDIAASFQAAVVDVLVEKMMRAAEATGLTTVALGGGVAANGPLRAAMLAGGEARGLRVIWPPGIRCTDNAAMIAAAAYHRFIAQGPDSLALETMATAPLTAVV